MGFLKIRLLVALILVVPLTAFILDKPKILIIGDSISIGYTPFVKANLASDAYVFHNPGNAGHTGMGLNNIDEWIGNEKWDIIQFNWGLWDLCYRHPDSKVQGNRDKVNGKITFEIDEYASNLDSLVSLLKAKTDAKLVFVTTTYVPVDEAGRFKKDAKRYNRIAKRIMKKHAIAVNDIFKQSKKIHKKFGKGTDDVHYLEEGYEELGGVISKYLKEEVLSIESK